MVISQMPPTQDSQTTFKPNLTCTFLSARARYIISKPDGRPCRKSTQTYVQEPHLIGFLFVSEKTNLGGPLTYGFRRPYKSEEGGPPKVDMAFVIVVVVFTKSGEIIREESNVNQKTSKSFRLAKHCSAWLGLGGVR